jgi:hypothetical protein
LVQALDQPLEQIADELVLRGKHLKILVRLAVSQELFATEEYVPHEAAVSAGVELEENGSAPPMLVERVNGIRRLLADPGHGSYPILGQYKRDLRRIVGDDVYVLPDLVAL